MYLGSVWAEDLTAALAADDELSELRSASDCVESAGSSHVNAQCLHIIAVVTLKMKKAKACIFLNKLMLHLWKIRGMFSVSKLPGQTDMCSQ